MPFDHHVYIKVTVIVFAGNFKSVIDKSITFLGFKRMSVLYANSNYLFSNLVYLHIVK